MAPSTTPAQPEADWVGEVTAMHIHRGGPGAAGPIEVDLLTGLSPFSLTEFTATNSLATTPALASEIAATPSAFYVNVHTSSAAAGLVRGQLAAFETIQLHVTLLGSEADPVVDPTARGACTMEIDAEGTLDYCIAMRSPDVGDIQAAHIHAVIDGAIFVNLDVPSALIDGAGVLSGSVTPTPAQLALICNAIGSFYVNVHTAAAPGGVARGSLAAGTLEFWAELSADQEVTPPTDPNGRGGATLQFTSFTQGIAHLAVPPTQGIENLSGAHVHEGPAGAPAPS